LVFDELQQLLRAVLELPDRRSLSIRRWGFEPGLHGLLVLLVETRNGEQQRGRRSLLFELLKEKSARRFVFQGTFSAADSFSQSIDFPLGYT
jgi:hypothetical protein